MAINNFDLTTFKDGFGQVVSLVLGDLDGYGGDAFELMMIKFLVLILVLAITKFSLERTPFGASQNAVIVNIISIAVSLIAVRYLTTEALVRFIWTPYGVLGVALSVFLPFLIYFFFIESMDDAVIRKVGWTIFAVIYGALAYLRWDTFAGEEFNLGWLYVAIVAISLLLIIFDSKVRYGLFLRMVRRGDDVNNAIMASKIEDKIAKVDDAISTSELGGADRRTDKLKKEKKRLQKALARAQAGSD